MDFEPCDFSSIFVRFWLFDPHFLIRYVYSTNNLSLNIEKTHFITFHSLNNRTDENPIVKIGKKTSQRAKFAKLLGLLLDENLSFNLHLKELSKKLSRTCGAISEVKSLLSPDVVLCLYKSLLSPDVLPS